MNLGSLLDYTEGLKGVYIDTAKEVGFTPGPEHFGYLLRVFCADTDEKAQQSARPSSGPRITATVAPRSTMTRPATSPVRRCAYNGSCPGREALGVA